MYVRFVEGVESEDYRWLDGLFVAARVLDEDGVLYRSESRLLGQVFDWFNEHLPVPPFRRKRRDGAWSADAVCWFRDDAGEPLRRMWDLVAIVREHGVPVRMIATARPGKIVYEDRYQVVAETRRWR